MTDGDTDDGEVIEDPVVMPRDVAQALCNDMSLAARVLGRTNNGGLATQLQQMSDIGATYAFESEDEGDDDADDDE